MVINHNLSAINTHRNLSVTREGSEVSMSRLSSGLRIFRAAEDPAGLAVSEKMRAQIRGLHQAERNIQDGISFLQTADGYISNTVELLQRVRELAVQGSNETYSDENRAQIQTEIDQLVDEVDRIASQAQFNGYLIFDGSWSEDGVDVQVGANVDQRETIKLAALNSEGLGLNFAPNGQAQPISMVSSGDANMMIQQVDSALNLVSRQQTNVGAYHRRFMMAQHSVSLSAENLQAAESRIRDADMAKEAVALARHNILSQSGLAMLAQANLEKQGVLRLLN